MVRSISRTIVLTLLATLIGLPMLAHGATAQDAATPEAVTTPCPALTSEDADAFVASWTAAWNLHDPAAVAALFAPEAQFHWGIGVDAQGPDEIEASTAAFFAAFPGIHLTVDRVWSTEDTVIIRYISLGIQETDYMGIPASQTTVTWTGIAIEQLACGQIVEHWSEADHFGRIQQQGALPPATPEAEATPAT